MQKFKVGDTVGFISGFPCDYNKGIPFEMIKHGLVPKLDTEGIIKYIGNERCAVEYTVNDRTMCLSFSLEKLKLIKSNNIMSTLIEKIRLAAKKEPQKSFIKAGVMTMDEKFTSEGKEAFDSFLVSKFGDEFKKEVIDPILAEEEK